ncbi:hypothetical protein EV589_1723 [Mycobacterium sp. BK558]|nr:hypothetical protein EV589_1723 [Mycobacterium sp. BK558]
MSGQRARSAIPAELRSAHPNIPGVPWWGAVLIAVVGCAIGFAVDAGSGGGALTSVFSVFYVMGCLVAVLAVRRAGLFTAVIQPPLLLFVIVPGAYFLMHSSEIRGIKDILINCGYPLIERFPLMFFTSAAVLVIGIARRYLGASPSKDATATGRQARGRMSAKLSSLVAGGTAPKATKADEAAEAAQAVDEAPRRRRTAERRTGAAKTKGSSARGERPTKRAAPSRSRHARPPQTEIIEPVVDLDRPRRRRPRPADEPPTESRRRARSSSREPREPREPRVPPAERREQERPQRSERPRPARRPRYDDYDGYEGRGGYEPLEPHAPLSPGAYHPISRVRYRGGDDTDEPEYRSRRRAPRDADADRWEYDI